MNDRQVALLPQPLKRRERGMQAEEAIEIDNGLFGNALPDRLPTSCRQPACWFVGGCSWPESLYVQLISVLALKRRCRGIFSDGAVEPVGGDWLVFFCREQALWWC